MNNELKIKERGFTLLFAVLIISIILSLSLSVGTLFLGEIKLSYVGRESQIAFYAADSGVECVLYWDIMQKKFSTTTPSVINCVNQQKNVGGSTQSAFSLTFDNESCVDVTVEKTNGATIVESQGKNKCSLGTRSVQRGIRVVYYLTEYY